MNTAENIMYRDLYARLEQSADKANELLLLAMADCQEALENAGERKSGLSAQSAAHLDALVGSLRLDSECKEGADYKRMYLTLFNALTGALQQLEWQNFGRAKEILIQAQQEAEEIFLDTAETPEEE